MLDCILKGYVECSTSTTPWSSGHEEELWCQRPTVTHLFAQHSSDKPPDGYIESCQQLNASNCHDWQFVNFILSFCQTG